MKHLVKFNEGNFWNKLKKERKEDKVLLQADEEIKKHLNKYLNNDYSFQYSVYVWKGPHENYQEIDVADFKFINIMVAPRYDWNSGKVTEFFLYLYFIDRYGDEIVVPFEKNSPTEKKIDLEYCKPWDKKLDTVLVASYVDVEDEIDYSDESRYPSRKGGGAMNLVPNSYETMNFLSEIKNTLEMINHQF